MAVRQPLKALSRLLRELALGPFRELLNGLDAVLLSGWRSLLLVGAGLLAGWWLYVPLHELLHALGCWAVGGEVTRLEIDPMYGARWIALALPFVAPGGDYAGRLSGFDTRGSDWIYFATDLAPFALALWPGFWWLRRAARARHAVAYGAALPTALAPLLSLTGDAYEMGSLVVVHLPSWLGRRGLIGDDLVAKAAEVAQLQDASLGAGVAAGGLLGLLWALSWILLARRLASWLGEPALAGLPSRARQPSGSG
jgi:hypothetical protein